MANGFNPAKTAQSRVFLLEGEARPDHQPDFESCLKVMGLSQDFGDITKIECPDPDKFGSFIEVGQVQGEVSRLTIDLVGRYPQDEQSNLARLARKRCSFDVHANFGTCQNPSESNSFDKKIILQNAFITSYSTDDLGALESGENAVINETASLSARQFIEILPLSFARRADDIVTNEVVDLIVFDTASCGDCEDESDGCERIYGITLSAGGSPSTPADIVYSLDKGATWYAHDIDSLGVAENPSAIAGLSAYIVVVSNDSNSLHYVLRADLKSTGDPDWTEVTTGFVSGGEPNDASTAGNTMFICGDGGYLYSTTDPTAGVTVLDAGVALTDDLNAISALSDTFAVAVGNASAIVKTENGSTWEVITPPTGVGVNLEAVYVKNEDEWFVGGTDGNLYYTLDGGTTWTTKTFSGSGSGTIEAIEASNNSVLFMSHTTSAPRGRLFQSFDGGYSWELLPQSSATLPLNDRLNAIAACSDDPNFVVAGGLADDASDGFLIVGSD